MPKPGISNNPNGRPAGTPNKLTAELRKKLKTIIDAELDRMPDLLAGLEPEKRLELTIKLLKFALPMVTPVNSCADEPINFNIFAD